jgi:hypothetical protein
MITIKARFDGRVFVPEGPVDLPVGCELEITIPAPASKEPAQFPLIELAALLGQFPENPQWPADGAAQHDHYLYRTPKKLCEDDAPPTVSLSLAGSPLAENGGVATVTATLSAVSALRAAAVWR